MSLSVPSPCLFVFRLCSAGQLRKQFSLHNDPKIWCIQTSSLHHWQRPRTTDTSYTARYVGQCHKKALGIIYVGTFVYVTCRDKTRCIKVDFPGKLNLQNLFTTLCQDQLTNDSSIYWMRQSKQLHIWTLQTQDFALTSIEFYLVRFSWVFFSNRRGRNHGMEMEFKKSRWWMVV